MTTRIITKNLLSETIAKLQQGTKQGWKTVFTKTYPRNYQGDISTDVQAAYAEQERRNKEYFESKLEPYH